MLLRQVALVSQSASVAFRELARVSAALQKQIARDFGPIWEIHATVDSFDALEDVPLGYWPIIIRDDVGEKYSAAGIHLDNIDQVVARVTPPQNRPRSLIPRLRAACQFHRRLRHLAFSSKAVFR